MPHIVKIGRPVVHRAGQAAVVLADAGAKRGVTFTQKQRRRLGEAAVGIVVQPGFVVKTLPGHVVGVPLVVIHIHVAGLGPAKTRAVEAGRAARRQPLQQVRVVFLRLRAGGVNPRGNERFFGQAQQIQRVVQTAGIVLVGTHHPLHAVVLQGGARLVRKGGGLHRDFQRFVHGGGGHVVIRQHQHRRQDEPVDIIAETVAQVPRDAGDAACAGTAEDGAGQQHLYGFARVQLPLHPVQRRYHLVRLALRGRVAKVVEHLREKQHTQIGVPTEAFAVFQPRLGAGEQRLCQQPVAAMVQRHIVYRGGAAGQVHVPPLHA